MIIFRSELNCGGVRQSRTMPPKKILKDFSMGNPVFAEMLEVKIDSDKKNVLYDVMGPYAPLIHDLLHDNGLLNEEYLTNHVVFNRITLSYLLEWRKNG